MAGNEDEGVAGKPYRQALAGIPLGVPQNPNGENPFENGKPATIQGEGEDFNGELRKELPSGISGDGSSFEDWQRSLMDSSGSIDLNQAFKAKLARHDQNNNSDSQEPPDGTRVTAQPKKESQKDVGQPNLNSLISRCVSEEVKLYQEANGPNTTGRDQQALDRIIDDKHRQCIGDIRRAMEKSGLSDAATAEATAQAVGTLDERIMKALEVSRTCGSIPALQGSLQCAQEIKAPAAAPAAATGTQQQTLGGNY